MKREDIEKAKVENAERMANIAYSGGGHIGQDDLERAFENGANWCINSTWHDIKTEAPDVNTIVLVEKEDGSICLYKIFAKSQMLGWKRWTYIKDLIPNEEG